MVSEGADERHPRFRVDRGRRWTRRRAGRALGIWRGSGVVSRSSCRSLSDPWSPAASSRPPVRVPREELGPDFLAACSRPRSGTHGRRARWSRGFPRSRRDVAERAPASRRCRDAVSGRPRLPPVWATSDATNRTYCSQGSIRGCNRMTSYLTRRAAEVLERRTTRRGVLARATMTAAALVVAPLRYVLRPGSAYAAVISCADAAAHPPAATAGQRSVVRSTMEITPPARAGVLSVLGWWQCDSSSYCPNIEHHPSTRYYIDCNEQCDVGGGCNSCTGNPTARSDGIQPWCNDTSGDYGCIGCVSHCANNDCGNRSACKNWFRYGQCHNGATGSEVKCTGPVRCRLVSCTAPWLNYTCNTTILRDNATCLHTASCL